MQSTAEEETDQSAVPASSDSGTPLFRHIVDWILLATAVGMLPLVAIHCLDLWYRTDLKFFPFLFLFSLLLARGASLQTHDQKVRSRFSLGMVVAGACAAVGAVVVFSPWLALLGITLTCIGWMLQRLGGHQWYELVGWALPVAIVLLLPLSDAGDMTNTLETSVASSASVLLDMAGVPQLASQDILELETGPLSSSLVCRGLASPYLLLALTLVLSVLTKRNICVVVLTLFTVPLWAWLASSMHFFAGVYTLSIYEKSIFTAWRNFGAQGLVLVFSLLAIWSFQWGVQNLLAPFTAYSSNTSTGVHKFFNWLVLWPAKDPLRKRKSVEPAVLAARYGNVFNNKYASVCLWGVLIAVVGAGGYLGVRLLGNREYERVFPLAINDFGERIALEQSLLPDDLGGMKLVDFNPTRNSESRFSGQYRFTWTYLAGLQRVKLIVEYPRRGFVSVEDSYLNSISRLAEPRTSFASKLGDETPVLVDEVTLLDDLYGRSYLAYATYAANESAAYRTAITESRLSIKSLSDAVAFQPTVVNVSLHVEGTPRLSDDKRENNRGLLLKALELLKPAIERAMTASLPE